MYSMTGYGKGDHRKDGIELTVEVKSVNNRFLDLTIVSYTDKRERGKKFFVDLGVAKAYEAAAKTLKETLTDVKDDLALSFYLRLPDVVRQEDTEGEDEEMKNALVSALQLALDNLLKMRFAEGERLKADLLSRIETIKTLREEIASRAPFVAEEYRKKMTERIRELVGENADETRIVTEAAIFSDKCNIDEELTRLSSHIAEFYSIAEEKLIGRKLDFLIQEFNRECNTICSKSNDSEVTRSALAMKNEIEKIREQIQNIE